MRNAYGNRIISVYTIAGNSLKALEASILSFGCKPACAVKDDGLWVVSYYE